ncbi:multifunctional CCA addition/repair protein [Agaribacter marinus]|uniref:Multifunctional CCA protein n=1 Tax=Agaribacter marinus TaxID=1431249 RepID=A0AA37WLQ9_9ALTE|nr:multifunctional CCA addition/repair protein [Agaribacter marinus]GLR72919.1 multifunctional CCA protein [Agaribacter marinus]
MQTYLVGGAVRDKLLGRAIKDRDYVVVGATTEEMLSNGFTQVGKDFPVFLHPKTKEEYALARTERKSGQGYTGFTCDSSPKVTLEEDLRRRDLTINAMAMDEKGNIIDPFNGQEDLNARTLRHVSDAFSEDPLRVLRTARFAARYADYGFAIHNTTLSMMRELVTSRELEHLSAPRVWQETASSLKDKHPHIFFTILKSIDGLSYWYKELDKLWGIPNPSQWHPEIDTGVHTMMVLEKAVEFSEALSVRFAALVHDLGKALTDTTNWPSHHGHDDLGLPAIKAFSERLAVPNDCKDLALLTSAHHSVVHRLYTKQAIEVLNVLNGADAWRKPKRFKQLLQVCEADFLGRKNFANRPYPQAEDFYAIYEKCAQVIAKPFVDKGLKGLEIKAAIESERLTLIGTFLSERAEKNILN